MSISDTDLGPSPMSDGEDIKFFNAVQNRKAVAALEHFSMPKSPIVAVITHDPRPSVTDVCADLAERIEDLIREAAGPDFPLAAAVGVLEIVKKTLIEEA